MSGPQITREDEEKCSPIAESHRPLVRSTSRNPSCGFLTAASINTIATVGIVFVNKRLFAHPYLRHEQISFAAFHFTVTAMTLYILSRHSINAFEPKRAPIRQIIPLSTAMIFNVVLPNLSLAHSSVTFYQIARILLTPCVAFLNYTISGTIVPRPAAIALVPTCLGVGIVSYFDTLGEASAVKATTTLGVVFAAAGVMASSLYTVWVAMYTKTLQLSSMQLLLNQAPVSVLMLLVVIPIADDITIWEHDLGPAWLLILASGIFACALNTSQYYIISNAGPVSSTVVGHFKAIVIVGLGWVASGRSRIDGTLVGIVLAFGGIVSYSIVMQRLAA